MTTTALDRANSKAQRLERELREARAEAERWKQIAGRLDNSCEALAANVAAAWDQGVDALLVSLMRPANENGMKSIPPNPYRKDEDA
jgi:hypothetical protein